jgi:N-acetyl-S-(2-succino)cysteine monooxygenase
MNPERQMILATNVYPVGGHLGGWRHPDSFDEVVMNFDAVKSIAQLAERGKFHCLFLADGNAVRQMEKRVLFENVAPSDRPASFEPFTLMGALSQATDHIGLFVTATTTYEQPYLLARRFASLDHLSHGRAVWNVVTGSYEGDSVNFGEDELPDRTVRYSRSIESLEVCKELWDSWADDAFPQDKATGKFLDSTRVRTIDHRGENFRVKGPLNVARSPQGWPVIFMAGQSDPGREMAAKHADAMFASARTKEQAQEVYADVKSRMAKYGRDPEHLKIIPGVGVNVAPTREEALALNRDLNRWIAPDLAVAHLSAQLHFDLSGYPVDGPLPAELEQEARGVTSIRKNLYEHATKHGLSILQAAEYLHADRPNPPFTGTPEEVVDELQDWFESRACDGFMIGSLTVPTSLERFVDLAVPELQRRGLYHADYAKGTLREAWGLELHTSNPHFQ